MKNVRRHFNESCYCFITVSTQNRRPVLTRPEVIQALRAAVKRTMSTHPFKIQAWVVLPDHMHFIIRVDDNQFDERVKRIKSFTTRALPDFSAKSQRNASKYKRVQGTLWHNRFYDHMIRSEKELYMYSLYCCFNPVKHGYVKNAIDWRYSTLRNGIASGRYPDSWQFINETWTVDCFASYDE
ncbi:putative transposase [Idiomarina aquatica]|uniref:Putative transposase n=1 Tax=Idiomarina aquatica TaxID=1327752 RepID=A0A4R6PNN4_9GAMM|nr:transposase [Idiomarina aquatica]TDP40196.1 putative transposase [Idiomarina aquatica]